MKYISGAWEMAPDELQAGLRALRPLEPREEQIVQNMTWWEFEDAAEAKAEAKGRAEGQAKTLLTLLRLKFGRLSAQTTRRVQAAPVAQLDAWTEAVLTAGTLEEALAAKPKP